MPEKSRKNDTSFERMVCMGSFEVRMTGGNQDMDHFISIYIHL